MASYEPVLYFSPLSRLCALSPILSPVSEHFFNVHLHQSSKTKVIQKIMKDPDPDLDSDPYK